MAERFPVRLFVFAFLGWTFDFYDLVLFSFLLIPIGHELHLSAAQEAWLLGVALGGSGAGGILFGYLSDLYGRKRIMMAFCYAGVARNCYNGTVYEDDCYASGQTCSTDPYGAYCGD